MSTVVIETGTATRRLPARPSPTDVNELLLRWHDRGDRDARDELFEQFLPLARRLASRYRNPYEPLEDLLQVAAVGLLGAIDRFDPRRGARFEGFAVPTILGELKRYFRNTGWSAHVPRGAQELALRVDRAAREMTTRAGRAPHVEELAHFLELEVEDVIIGLDAATAHYSVSLDAPSPGSDGDEPQTLGDGMGRHDGGFELVDVKLSFGSAMARLPYRERTALRLRIDQDLRQADIAERMGCSQMQVSRLLRRAATRVRELTDPQL